MSTLIQGGNDDATQRQVLLWFEERVEESEIRDYLTKNGLLCIAARNRQDFDNLAINAAIVIIDLSLRSIDAILLGHELKQLAKDNVPFVIIVGDKSEDYTHITALDLGADDYIIKPIKPHLLLKRIIALGRRKNITLQVARNAFQPFSIDSETHLVHFYSKIFEFPKIEFELLRLLSSSPHKVFKREEIAALLWKDENIAHQRTIDVHIWNIRKVLGKEIIYTVKGFGYGFNQPPTR